MLNWIVWNGTVFDIENVLTLNWFVSYRTVLTFNCVQTKPVLILNWIIWIRTVQLRNKLCTYIQTELFEIELFFDIETVLTLNWFV